MNEKLNIQNLSDELAENYGINRKDAETFVKEFFSVIEEGLKKDKYVKIKGFGTFKLIEVDSRESINVNTGERFEIQGHTKVSFIPDNSVKEAVNKPFSAFQTVVLADGVTIDAQEENLVDALSDDIPEEEPAIVEPVIEEPAIEEPVIEETPEVEPEPVAEDVLTKEDPAAEQESEVKEPAIEEPAPEEEPVSGIPVGDEPMVTETVVKESAVEEPTNILQMFDDEAIKKKDQPVSHQQEVLALKLSEEKRNEISKKAERSSTPYIMFMAVLAIMACLGIVAYIYYPALVLDKDEPTISTSQINSFKQSEDVVTTPATESSVEMPVSETQSQTETPTVTPAETPAKREITVPITVREESVPAPAAQPQTTNQPAASKQATQVTPKPVATSTSSAGTIKVGNNTYAYDGEIETHVLQKGETLFALSRKYYGSNAMYVVIIDYNKDVIKNPDNVPEGTKLRIPKVVKK